MSLLKIIQVQSILFWIQKTPGLAQRLPVKLREPNWPHCRLPLKLRKLLRKPTTKRSTGLEDIAQVADHKNTMVYHSYFITFRVTMHFALQLHCYQCIG